MEYCHEHSTLKDLVNLIFKLKNGGQLKRLS